MEHTTFIELLQFKEDAVYVTIHILAQSASATEPYGWFEDQQNQELLALVYDLILSKAAGDLDSEHSLPVKSKFQIKRSRNLRVLFCLKPLNVRQHLVIPQQLDSYSQITPLAAFVSDDGKKVLPFLSRQTRCGSGYKSYRVLSKCVEVYVDSYPLTDPRGVFKVLARLDSSCHVGPDLISYFTQSSSSSSSEPAFDDASAMMVGAALRGDVREELTRKRRDHGKGRKTLFKKKCHVPMKHCVVKRFTNQQSLQEVVGGGGEKSSVVKQDSPSPTLECINLAENEMDMFFNFSSVFQDGVVPSHLTVTGGETPPLVPSDARFGGGAITPSRNCHTIANNSSQKEGTVEERRKDYPRNIHDDTRSGDHLKIVTDETTTLSRKDWVTHNAKTVVAISPLKHLESVVDLEAGYFAHNSTCESDSSQSDLPRIPEVIDLTDCSEIFDCDEVHTSQCSQMASKELLTLSDQRRKGMKSAEEWMRGVKSVGELSLYELKMWLYMSKPLLINIFKGIISSHRHDDYVSGCKKRGALMHQCDTLFSKEQVEIITDMLLQIFCGKHMQYFGYVMSVLLPECMIRIIGDIHQISFREAEMVMMNSSNTSGVYCSNIKKDENS